MDKVIGKIREKLNEGKMSVLVGSGFSKNANPDFPSWSQLLSDLIIELYNDEFIKWNRNKKNREEEFINKIINREGYLEVVDQYIKYKGNREYIDIYIENKIKDLNDDKNNDLEIHKLLLECKWNNIYTTNYDTLLEKANPTIELVKNSSELSVSNKNRIIKLHGSLRKNEEIEKCKYGFDRDKKCHYIISKEDYMEYHKRHEAFMNLMRISILQENFCLIGFSGNDPNFLSWIDWIRDILEEQIKYNLEKGKDRVYKIYLIDIINKDEEQDVAKKIFYENHLIKFVPLRKIYKINDHKKLFLNFLYDLKASEKDDNPISNIQYNINPAHELKQIEDNTSKENSNKVEELDYKKINAYDKNEYINRWSKLTKEKFEDIYEKIDPIKEYEKYFRLSHEIIYDYYSDRNHFALRKFFKDIFIESASDSEKLKFIDLVNLILRNSYCPLSGVYEDKEKSQLIDHFENINFDNLNISEKEIWFDFLFQLVRDARYRNNESNLIKWKKIADSNPGISNKIKNNLYYEEILFHAINLNYQEVEKRVSDWIIEEDEVNAEFLIKKAFLIMIYTNSEKGNEAIYLIEKAKTLFKNDQEKLWATEILKYYNLSANLDNQNNYEGEINKFKSNGYYSLMDITESFSNLFKEKSQELKPYEKTRYKGKSSIFGNSKSVIDYWNSVKFIEFIFAYGIPLKINIKYDVVYLINSEWYKFYSNLIKYDSSIYSALFTSLQYGDNDMDEEYIIRLMQDIVFLRKIEINIKKEIFKKMLSNFMYLLNVNKTFNKKLLFALAEFVPILKYGEWKDLWLKIWGMYKNNELNVKDFFYRDRWGIYIPVIKMLSYITDKTMIQEIFEELILFDSIPDNRKYIKENNHLVEQYLFHLINKKNKINIILLSKKVEAYLTGIINSGGLIVTNLIKLYYIRNILTDSQKQDIINSLFKKEEFSGLYIDEDNLELLLRFGFNYNELNENIKKRILKPDFLFKTGINVNSSGKIKSVHFVKYSCIMTFLKKEWEDVDDLNWKDNEIKKIYGKLKTSFELIKTVIHTDNPVTYPQAKIILKDMYYFLKSQKNILGSEPDYPEIYQFIENLFFKERGYKDIKEGLLYRENNIQISVLSDLFNELRDNPTKELKEEWMILIFKVLRQEEPYLEAALEYLAYLLFLWLKGQDWIKQYTNFYLMILNKYWENPIEKGDRIQNETCLIKIALTLKNDMGISDPIIDEWLDYKNKSDYIDINEIEDKIV